VWASNVRFDPLDQVFDNFGLLVVGWSSEWDTALKSALLRAPSRRYALYWASRGEIRSLAQELVEQRGGRIFEIADADSFFLKLDETLLALKQASRPHRQSAEIAVALAKLYCRDDKFSMEWAEFLHVEVENVRQLVTASDYPNARYNGETLNRIVNELLIRTEILRRASLICGRWGTIEANRAVGRAVQSLSFASPFMAGNVALVAMRELGASICFYWNMAGLLDRSDWKAVEELQRVKIKHTRGDVDAVTSLPFATYDSVDWKFLNELNNRSTPINDFLAGKFRSEARDISLNAINADELFDEVELAIALGFAHRRAQSGTDMWFPVGRFIWKNSGRRLEEELDKIESITDGEAFFKAGMLGGSKAAAALTLKEMRSHRQQIARYFRGMWRARIEPGRFGDSLRGIFVRHSGVPKHWPG
jgi:hypothetical protein